MRDVRDGGGGVDGGGARTPPRAGGGRAAGAGAPRTQAPAGTPEGAASASTWPRWCSGTKKH